MNAKLTPETESFDAAELGAMMREMRENLGHDLETVASDLRIRLVYLEAIESGRLNDLPGNAYVSGFLRSYSDFLGLEGDEIVRRFKMAGAEISSQPQLHLPSPVEEGRLPTGSILVVAAVIAAAAYGGWYYLSSAGNGPMETVASLPKELSGLVDGAKNQTEATDVSNSPKSAVSPTPATSAAAPDAAQPAVAAAPQQTPVSDTQASEGSASEPNTTAAAPETPAITPQPETAPSVSAVETNSAETEAAAPSSTSVADATPTPETPESQSAAPQPAAEPPVETAAPARPAETVTPTPPATPETTVQSATAPAAETPVQTPEPAAAPAPVTPSAETVRTAAVTSPPRDPELTSVSDASSSATASDASAPSETSGAAPGGVRIVVRATADSYVAVRTGENEPLFSQLMRPGDSYEVPSGADLVLETGNAGGLQITVGGKRAPSLGPIGQIRRNIPLDAEKLLGGLN